MSISAVFEIASSAMTAQSKRLNVVASNLANVDSAASSTGGAYKAKQVVFSATPIGSDKSAVGVRVARVIDDPSPPRLQFDPNHPLADARGFVTLPNVDPVEEMVNMISASRAYQTNADVMNAAKTMALRTLSLLQT
ncbi:MAG: flagellar basal body rod protein FlgC [Proteobacteria bacterium]|nr:flagellar basal body rod protein FlgC [Burkholderiales bacterium]